VTGAVHTTKKLQAGFFCDGATASSADAVVSGRQPLCSWKAANTSKSGASATVLLFSHACSARPQGAAHQTYHVVGVPHIVRLQRCTPPMQHHTGSMSSRCLTIMSSQTGSMSNQCLTIMSSQTRSMSNQCLTIMSSQTRSMSRQCLTIMSSQTRSTSSQCLASPQVQEGS